MKVVYIAGPYEAYTIPEVYANILKARDVATKYWELGYAVICPHSNTAFMPSTSALYEGDIEILSRCDIVVMMCGWEKSKGASLEHKRAIELGKGIIYESSEVTDKRPQNG